MAEDRNVHCLCFKLLTENLFMCRISKKIFPWCNISSATCHELITAVDETLVYGCDVETWRHSSQRKSEPSPDLKRYHLYMKLNLRTIFIVFFNCQGCVHYEFFAGGRTMNQKIYLTKVSKRSAEKEMTS
jgi:hypothetical protein